MFKQGRCGGVAELPCEIDGDPCWKVGIKPLKTKGDTPFQSGPGLVFIPPLKETIIIIQAESQIRAIINRLFQALR